MLPILYQNKDFILYSYPFLMGLGWGIAYQMFFSLSPDKGRESQIIYWGIFASAWIGAKLFFLLTIPKEHHYLLWEVSFWTGGGFVFYGGFLTGAAFLLAYHALWKRLTMDEFWPVVPAVVFGHAVGRIGCFLSGCCYGKETDGWWGLYMHDHYRHPTQLFEASGLLLIGLYLYFGRSSKIHRFSFYLIAYGLLRFGVELLRGDEIRGHWGPLTPSEWISLLLLLTGSTTLLKNKALAVNKSF